MADATQQGNLNLPDDQRRLLRRKELEVQQARTEVLRRQISLEDMEAGVVREQEAIHAAQTRQEVLETQYADMEKEVKTDG